LRLLPFNTKSEVTRAQVLDQLRTRSSVIRKAMQQLDLRIWPLQDHEMLQLLAQCLAPGAPVPSFIPEQLTGSQPVQASTRSEATSERQRTSSANVSSPAPVPPDHAASSRPGRGYSQPLSPPQRGRRNGNGKTPARRRYKKRLYGVHGTFHYTSAHAEPRFEAGALAVADLIAPSSIHVAPNVVEIQAGRHTRYLRSFTVTGYGHHLACGWASRLHELGLPLMVSTHLEPLDSGFMIRQLERALTRLESQRLSDQKAVRIPKADHTIEAEQIRHVTRALASRRLKIFEVSMTICVHAGSLERLEQRSRYLLSHLRDMQLQARPALRQQDLAWQSCLPVGLDLLQHWTKLTSDVVSTMLPATSGTVGTKTGVFLGYSGSGLARCPVYLDPWQLPNPHMVVIGETGQGKSWLGKVLGIGLLGLAQADLVGLDRDDDFLELHRGLPGESQRYNLARSCPINFFDLPFGPDDVDLDDPADILAEFLDNQLLVGLALLVTDETTRLSKSEEAYLIQVARATYASKGITSEAIRRDPQTLLLPAPTLAEYIEMMRQMPASSESMRQSLLERLEKASYLFQGGQTSVSLDTPLTSFNIKDLDEKWYAFMTYVVQSFLMRHRALKRDDRYLAYVVEESSYLLRHPAGRRFLEYAARSFRKLGIMLITISQHPDDFLEAGQVVLSNAGTAFFLGMQRQAVEKLQLPEELERIILDGIPGHCVMRVGNEYAPLTVWTNSLYRALFTTDPAERRAMRRKQQGQQQQRQT
jgi:hypothetical protein